MRNLKSYSDFINESKSSEKYFNSDVADLLEEMFSKVKKAKYEYKDGYATEVEFEIEKSDFIITYKTLETDFEGTVLSKREFVPVLTFEEKEEEKGVYKIKFTISKVKSSNVKPKEEVKKKDFDNDSDKDLLKKLDSNIPDYKKEKIMDELVLRGVDFKNPFETEEDELSEKEIEEKMKKKHKKTNESIQDYDNDDDFLESPEYFVDTYLNGNFSQLRKMLAKFIEDDRMDELKSYIRDYNYDEIIDWVIKNSDDEDVQKDDTELDEDESFLKSPEYFVSTYDNGNFSQLREMLKLFRKEGRMSELLDYIEDFGNSGEIKDWIFKTNENVTEEIAEVVEPIVESITEEVVEPIVESITEEVVVKPVIEEEKIEETITILKFGSVEWNEKYGIKTEEEVKPEPTYESLVIETLKIKKFDEMETLDDVFNKVYDDNKLPSTIDTIQK